MEQEFPFSIIWNIILQSELFCYNLSLLPLLHFFSQQNAIAGALFGLWNSTQQNLCSSKNPQEFGQGCPNLWFLYGCSCRSSPGEGIGHCRIFELHVETTDWWELWFLTDFCYGSRLKTKRMLLEKQGRAGAKLSGFPGSELGGVGDVIIKV